MVVSVSAVAELIETIHVCAQVDGETVYQCVHACDMIHFSWLFPKR